ncbi:Mps3p KNAG_0B04990 [Huiozyma naganishii CBS 8797]|uniref:SUN domain-containing protein n=1 Tax=Huiozyma naganishii (strain ATCC MYA-139 / BCRC 22969 / CBS 8797 / KCTC 17520 / NBRC 10181 / NCYC 3082 / Yp74L-3) TaxID=1071383 RepID=J7RHB8_HUIN7|nr:hypothetical protein KNAG_0B04990 [Kazachstania naganishii CBS 8797]CCK68933.1 hypothetical protein KNAG_0B04990 [Kazachstania naganishii CBS 8797]
MGIGGGMDSGRSVREKYRDLLIDRVNGRWSPREDDDDTYERFRMSLDAHGSDGTVEDDDGEDEEDREYVDECGSYADEHGSYLDDELSDESEDLGDRSFIQDTSRVPSDTSESILSFEEIPRGSGGGLRRVLLGLFVLICFAVVFAAVAGNRDGSVTTTTPPGSLLNIQKQINHLYNELRRSDERRGSEFDDKLKVVVQQFEKNIKKLLPGNILNFQHELDSLHARINQLRNTPQPQPALSLENITTLQTRLVAKLQEDLPGEIPVMVNNESSVLVIPELHSYLAGMLKDILQYTETVTAPPLDYDLNNYIKEVLTNEFQYVDKGYFIAELNRTLQENKLEILQELKNHLQRQLLTPGGGSASTPAGGQQCSTILLKRLINEIYDAKQQSPANQCDRDDLDFATYAQGTRLIKSLTSQPYRAGNALPATELLADDKCGGSSTYWQCQHDAGTGALCSLAIRFNRPLHLTRLSYVHGRLTNNLHVMHSAPKHVAVYVKLADKRDTRAFAATAHDHSAGEPHRRDSTYTRIGIYEYDLASADTEQQFPLPDWFIQAKPLVRSVLFSVEENYGSEHYTSLKKFIVNAVTERDLQLFKDNALQQHQRQTPQQHDVPAFGQDEPDY